MARSKARIAAVYRAGERMQVDLADDGLPVRGEKSYTFQMMSTRKNSAKVARLAYRRV